MSFFRTLTFKLSAVLVIFFSINGIALVLWDQRDLLRDIKLDTQIAFADEGITLANELTPLIQDPEATQSFLDSVAYYYQGMELFILDVSGNVLHHASDIPSQVKRPQIDMEPILHFIRGSEMDYPIDVEIPTSDDLEFVFSAAEIPEATEPRYAMITFLGGGDDPVLSFWDKYGALLIRTILFSLAIAAITGAIIWAGFTRRVNRAASKVRRFKTGNNHVKIDDDSRDELGAVAAAFNDMVDRVDRMLKELELKERSRSELVATVSHELQTPLTVIQGNIETMLLHQQEIDGPTMDHKLRTIHDQINHLSNLIGDLFTISILDTGQMHIKPEPFLLSELTEDTLAEFDHVITDKKLTIKRNFLRPPEPVLADPIRIRQVLRNLLSNAIKFTPPEGTITLSTQRSGDNLDFTISDTGSGIPQDELKHIFDSFYRSRDTHKQKVKGTGLGLTICQKILGLHQSILTVDSKTGEGATFSFKLPFFAGPE
ncbi:MAG: HAMP domain-containing histidine kinase [Candidatus Marinimicrobia bacterium]|nr:HAMP domain-containing histidine kinase [Candidatus Neomarinimicrobiota bacterium]